MTFDSPNPSPRSPELLSRLLTDPDQRYMLVDIGARSANHHVYRHLSSLCRIIGFEVDQEECDRLNAHNPNGLARFYPYAIAGEDGERTFHITRLDLSSGLNRSNPAWMSRFPWRNLDVMREVQVPTIRLDTFVARENVHHMDFLKVDVEGAELEVMRGARQSMSDMGVLCIQTELWWDPVMKGQPTFAELDTFIRDAGFRFYDLSLHRQPRTTLPVGRLGGAYDPATRSVRLRYDQAPYGQATTGDALYFRDPVGERREGWTHKTLEWTDERLLRLCGLLDIFDYGDCAIEVLEEFRDQLSQRFDVDALIDAMTPSVENQILGYDIYLKSSNDLRRQFNRLQWGAEPLLFTK
ncbi:MAG: FkbM family methyltransferase [Alphaproteobacteria bacterium]